MRLTDRIDSVKGIGEKTRVLFEKLNITTIGGLLTYYPRNYESYAAPSPITSLTEHGMGVIEASVSHITQVKRGSRVIVSCEARDPSGRLTLLWYNQPYIKKSLKIGYRYIFRGRVVKKGNGMQLEQPKIYRREDYEKLRTALQPVYSLTRGLTNHLVSRSMRQALVAADDFPEYCSARLRKRYALPGKAHALEEIHFPKSRETMLEARKALVFEEFFLFSVFLQELTGQKKDRKSQFRWQPCMACEQLLASLPYELTGDQKTVWKEIQQDVSEGNVMVRLIQGDVGSGKTILAILSLLQAVQNGCQGCFMVPTEVLAKQHYESVRELLNPFGVRVTLLVGSMTAREKRDAYEKMKAHQTDIIIGTHALIQEKAQYARLGLVITDEQHRFGVKQREKLAEKSEQPHILVMSATPIPRTLAMMLYADMDLSVIRQLPSKRLPIKSCVVGTEYRNTAFQFIKKQLEQGRQAYIVCPMIEENDSTDVENVTDYLELLKERLGDTCSISSLHGRMKPEEKNHVMELFARGEIQILVSTTVVEVGINVPNATVMMIENAERFGLAQLHQLRGRVGRGEFQSYCILMSQSLSEETKERLEILKNSNDGFYIASEDLRLRGPGDLFGIRQSGEMNFKIGDIYQDAELLKAAKEAADTLSAEERAEIIDKMHSNGANDIFLFLNAYSTI